MTLSDLWPQFQGHDVFSYIEYLRNDTRKSHKAYSYYRTSIVSRMLIIKNDDIFQWP